VVLYIDAFYVAGMSAGTLLWDSIVGKERITDRRPSIFRAQERKCGVRDLSHDYQRSQPMTREVLYRFSATLFRYSTLLRDSHVIFEGQAAEA